VVLSVQDAESDISYLVEEIGIREPIWRVFEEVARKPIVVGDVVILREEPTPDFEDSGDFLKPGLPVRHVVQNSKIENCVERPVPVVKVRNITPCNGDPVAILDQTVFCSLDHLWVVINCGDAPSTKALNFSSDALTRSTTDVENLPPFRASAQSDELRDHDCSQSLGPHCTIDVEGLRPVHPHGRNSMTSTRLEHVVTGHCLTTVGRCSAASLVTIDHLPRRIGMTGMMSRFLDQVQEHPAQVDGFRQIEEYVGWWAAALDTEACLS
jgi:hypothetical protein